MQKIVIIGAGYVGLVTGTCLASKNYSVIIVEKNRLKIKNLLNGQIPFYEPYLEKLVIEGQQKNLLSFTDNLSMALLSKPDFIFSCVETPVSSDGSADLSSVYKVAQDVGKHITDDCIFINKSTVPVGTTQRVEFIIREQIKKRNITINFHVASNPEFLREGSAVNDFLYPDRIIVGTDKNRTKEKLFELYKPFIKEKKQFISMSIESAELSKYAANSMLAMRITFMNQLAQLAEKTGANIEDIKMGISLDKRIGKYFLNAGVGYGGSCFSKDIRALCQTGQEHDVDLSLFREIENINEKHKNWFFKKILSYYNNNISGKKVGIWGLSFKPKTDDIRNAPSISIIKNLLAKNAKIIAYDPAAHTNISKLFGDKISLAKSPLEVLKTSDALIILTEWDIFTTQPIQNFAKLADKIVFDGRNCFSRNLMFRYGIEYFSVGRNNKINLEKGRKRVYQWYLNKSLEKNIQVSQKLRRVHHEAT